MAFITRKQHHYLVLSGLLFTFFWTWSSAFSLISLWLNQKIGLRGAETGIIFSIVAFTALCAQPLYGFLQDKLGLRKNLLWLIGGLLLASGPFFVFVCTPLLHFHILPGAVSVGLYVGATFFAGIGALESYTERVSRIVGFEYGKSRMWGSLGWAGATFIAGMLFNLDPNLNFWMGSVSACLFLGLLWWMREVQPNALNELEFGKSNALTISDAFGLLKLPNFWALVVFVCGVSVYNVYDQQFPVYFASLFHNVQRGNEMFGFLNSFQVFLEAGGMFLAPLLVNKIGAKRGLLLSGLIMALRIFGSGMASDTLTISLMKLLHAVELPILLIAMFKYITTQFDQRLSATLYLVGFQFITSICATVLSPLAGRGYDQMGFADTYMIMAALVLSLTLISSMLLRGDKPQNDLPSLNLTTR
ncbi:MFS transporter [Enterobacteriaceae bacterium H18W14]|uniref:MFS transporter n=1 Tax=Dryocola boscaweniae TaxID=2925397 RepID=UPI0022F1339B|nr:MFS transporter [Dryocola boscaweniae]MCT4713772.1 MFS transporter [Dryocola boscaweniae]